MSEEEEEIPEHAKTKCKVIWVNGEALIDLSDSPIKKKQSPVHPFTFGKLQGKDIEDPFEEMVKEFQDILNMPFIPGKWKLYKIENGEIKEIKDEDEENDNRK